MKNQVIVKDPVGDYPLPIRSQLIYDGILFEEVLRAYDPKLKVDFPYKELEKVFRKIVGPYLQSEFFKSGKSSKVWETTPLLTAKVFLVQVDHSDVDEFEKAFLDQLEKEETFLEEPSQNGLYGWFYMFKQIAVNIDYLEPFERIREILKEKDLDWDFEI